MHESSFFVDMSTALNNALYIGRYTKGRNEKYKKDRKKVKEMLHALEEPEDIPFTNFLDDDYEVEDDVY